MKSIELHLHTMYANSCGKNDAATIVSDYLNAGISAIAVTEHYSRKASWFKEQLPLGDDLHGFLRGYRLLKEEGARRGLNVYKGAEIGFDEYKNDFLVFGWPDKLLADPEEVFSMGIRRFSEIARAQGAVIIQAHPFRKTTRSCVPAYPSFLDGIEVFNPGEPNRNELAQAFADEHPELFQTQGSDYHTSRDTARACIGVEVLPEDEAALAKLLKERNFVLLDRH